MKPYMRISSAYVGGNDSFIANPHIIDMVVYLLTRFAEMLLSLFANFSMRLLFLFSRWSILFIEK